MKLIVVSLILFVGSLCVSAQELSKDVLSNFNETESAIKSAGKLGLKDCIEPKADINRKVLESSLKAPNDIEINISLISEDYAMELFDEIASLSHIPFGYPKDGCTARAHEMSRFLDEKGIITGKAFLEGDLQVPDKESSKGYIEWWFHVAPIVKVNKGGKILVYVFDPSIFSEPVTLEDWIRKQTKHNSYKSYTSYQTKRYNFAPYQRYYNLKDYLDSDIRDTNKVLKKYSKVLQKRLEKRLKK